MMPPCGRLMFTLNMRPMAPNSSQDSPGAGMCTRAAQRESGGPHRRESCDSDFQTTGWIWLVVWNMGKPWEHHANMVIYIAIMSGWWLPAGAPGAW